MNDEPIEIQHENREETTSGNTNHWQLTEPVAPPRLKAKITKNVEGSKFVGGFLSTFLESLETTLKGVLGQHDEKR
jgi:hypothetical protein